MVSLTAFDMCVWAIRYARTGIDDYSPIAADAGKRARVRIFSAFQGWLR